MLRADNIDRPGGAEEETRVQAPPDLELFSISSLKNSATVRFESLVSPHLDALHRSALRLTHHRAAAEGLVQDVMLRAWRSFHTFQEGTNIRPWLHRILMNAHFSNYRKRSHAPEVVDTKDVGDFYIYEKVLEARASGEAGNPEELLLNQILETQVQKSVEALPVQFRAVVILADLQGFSHNEIAEILGVPYGTVLSRLSRGRHMLQRRLWEYTRRRRCVV